MREINVLCTLITGPQGSEARNDYDFMPDGLLIDLLGRAGAGSASQ